MPKFRTSVIVPTYNREHFLEKCLSSIFSQTVQPSEIIIVDDGSSDNTRETVFRIFEQNSRLPKTFYIYQQNNGVANARNNGMSKATGEIIFFLDSDDYWEQNHIELHLAAYDISTDISLVASHAKIIDPDNNLSSQRKARILGSTRSIKTLTDNELCSDKFHLVNASDMLSLIVLNKASFLFPCISIFLDRLKLNIHFEESLKFLEDVDFLARALSASNKIVFIDEPTFVYHIHSDNSINSNQSKGLKTENLTDLIKVRIRLLPLCQTDYEFNHLTKIIADRYRLLGWAYENNGDNISALQSFKRCFFFSKKFRDFFRVFMYKLWKHYRK